MHDVFLYHSAYASHGFFAFYSFFFSLRAEKEATMLPNILSLPALRLP